MEHNSVIDDKIILSPLPKTWIIDLDGTIVEHNGYLEKAGDKILPKSLIFLKNIPLDDTVIIVTSRTEDYSESTEDYLKRCEIRYDHIIYGLPVGERVLINDEKPSGLKTAYSINIKRDKGIETNIEIDNNL